jgi:hypothetical protein
MLLGEDASDIDSMVDGLVPSRRTDLAFSRAAIEAPSRGTIDR